MGFPVQFNGSNFVFKAPEGREDVCDMHCFTNGVAVVSCVQLTEEERQEVIRTGQVWLSVLCGPNYYPTFIGSESSVRSVVVDYGKVWKK